MTDNDILDTKSLVQISYYCCVHANQRIILAANFVVYSLHLIVRSLEDVVACACGTGHCIFTEDVVEVEHAVELLLLGGAGVHGRHHAAEQVGGGTLGGDLDGLRDDGLGKDGKNEEEGVYFVMVGLHAFFLLIE